MHLRIIMNGYDSISDRECLEIVTKFKNAGNRRLLLQYPFAYFYNKVCAIYINVIKIDFQINMSLF